MEDDERRKLPPGPVSACSVSSLPKGKSPARVVMSIHRHHRDLMEGSSYPSPDLGTSVAGACGSGSFKCHFGFVPSFMLMGADAPMMSLFVSLRLELLATHINLLHVCVTSLHRIAKLLLAIPLASSEPPAFKGRGRGGSGGGLSDMAGALTWSIDLGGPLHQ